MTNKHPDKSYLGDGAYIQLGSFLGEIVITTEDGVSVQNSVTLDPRKLDALMGYLLRHGIVEMRNTDETPDPESTESDEPTCKLCSTTYTVTITGPRSQGYCSAYCKGQMPGEPA